MFFVNIKSLFYKLENWRAIGKDKHCFSLVMYGFRSVKALYLASLPFIMFVFFNFFLYYFQSILSFVFLIKVFLTKNEVLSFPQEFICVFIPYFVGAIPSKNVKSEGFGESIKRGLAI